jgi:hypothetical protein
MTLIEGKPDSLACPYNLYDNDWFITNGAI